MYPHKTVLENVTIAPIRVQHIPREEAERSGAEYLQRVGLCDKVAEYPTKLSGGRDAVFHFAEKFSCSLQIAQGAEHYFHTPAQLRKFEKWLQQTLH